MPATQVQRTLVKSPPELWTELSDPATLARHLGELGEIRITRLQPERRVEWKAERASGSVVLQPSGWGTKVTLTAGPVGAAVDEEPDAIDTSVASGEPEPRDGEQAALEQPARAPATSEPLASAGLTVVPGITSAATPERANSWPIASDPTVPEHAAADTAPEPVQTDEALDPAHSDTAPEPDASERNRHAPLPTPAELGPVEEREPRRGLFARIGRWFRGEPLQADAELGTEVQVSAAGTSEQPAGEAQAADPQPLRAEMLPAFPVPPTPEARADAAGPVITPGTPATFAPAAPDAAADLPHPPGPSLAPRPPDPGRSQPPTRRPSPIDVVTGAPDEVRRGDPQAPPGDATTDAPAHADSEARADSAATSAARGEPTSPAHGADAGEMSALLMSVLDRLGAAHHRPFSRP
jgi:hypothetical protein